MTAKIICGDALETLDRLADAGEKFDALLTDPPYCSGGMSISARRVSCKTKYYTAPRQENIEYDDAQDQVAFAFTLRALFIRAKRILTDAGYCFVFCDWRQLPLVSTAFQSSGLMWRGVVPWDKGNARPNRGIFTPRCEYVVWGTRGAAKSDKFGVGVLSGPPPTSKKRSHLSEKPVGILADLLKILPDGARSVIDPFCGSGSVGEAALGLGLDFTGVDNNEYYANIAKQRLGAVENESI